MFDPILEVPAHVDETFAREVMEGLSAPLKHIPSHWFYDAEGSRIFQQIMHLEDYYLTRAEYDCLERHSHELIRQFSGGKPFRLVEFGAGDGLKTKLLLRAGLEAGIEFTYWPIDISADAMVGLQNELEAEFPDLQVHPLAAEYFTALEQLPHDEVRTVVLFLGSNIGNFRMDEAGYFLRQIESRLQTSDLILIGFDLKKDPHRILRAYDDSEGVTREFNLNLLRRLNRELGSDIDPDQFTHLATYDPVTGETKSFLISKSDQTVHFSVLNRSIDFAAWEPIWLELSQKYDHLMVEKLARETGFWLRSHYHDSQRWFLDSLWEKGK